METISEVKSLWSFIKDELDLNPDKSDMHDLLYEMSVNNDIHQELSGEEYRIIHEDEIDDIATDEIKEIVQDCYLNGTDLNKLWWIEINWEKTAKNCIDADGYGHHFSTYDGCEYYHEGWYFFRTN